MAAAKHGDKHELKTAGEERGGHGEITRMPGRRAQDIAKLLVVFDLGRDSRTVARSLGDGEGEQCHRARDAGEYQQGAAPADAVDKPLPQRCE